MIIKFKEKDKSIALRRQGFSYSEILRRVPVAKSSLSLWLRSVGLSKRQKQRLTEKKLASMRRGWIAVHEAKLARIVKIKKSAKGEVRKLIKEPLWIAGTMLYWAEGSKEKEWTHGAKVAFSNMDVVTHRLFMRWMKRYAGINENEFRYELYIHENADIKKAKKFWIKNLCISNKDLRIYFKKNNPKSVRKNRGVDYHGVLRILVIGGANLNRRIAGWIEGINDHFLYSGVV